MYINLLGLWYKNEKQNKIGNKLKVILERKEKVTINEIQTILISDLT